ncbi:hypothetical protein PB01_02930 [Psychrobacillus glaciei]|uniref:DUF3888 domain-containing protein n=1 Tax=Psychrobacillus glaciei TaxID=2283160 RepID=A0A5J6SJL5_9BACI|nr:hypothetical protein PB01_02930 [Psychrobacillus glaciei]
MIKRYLILLGCLFLVFTLAQVVKSETNLEVEGMYVTTEDIILDILLPIIDKRVIKEYGQDAPISWHWNRIVGMTYNDNHSYDVAVRIEIPSKNLDDVKVDLVKVRISPSCDSDSINKQKCNHGFEIEILDYKHLSP